MPFHTDIRFVYEIVNKGLQEIKDLECETIVILESIDIATIDSIKNFNCKLVYQSGKGFGDALIEGINNVQTKFLCIFNADGSFDPKYLNEMLKIVSINRLSLYEAYDPVRTKKLVKKIHNDKIFYKQFFIIKHYLTTIITPRTKA